MSGPIELDLPAASASAESGNPHPSQGEPPEPAQTTYHFSDQCSNKNITAANPAAVWEVFLYAVLVVNFVLRDATAPTNTADEAAFARSVDKAITGLAASLHTAIGVRTASNRRAAASKLDDVVQVMRRPKALGSAWRVRDVAFTPVQLFDFLHKQLKSPNPYCRDGRPRWYQCKGQIGELLKSSTLLSIIEQLEAQQSLTPPDRVEDAEALAPEPRLGQPPRP